jgi:stage II sporulation protein D
MRVVLLVAALLGLAPTAAAADVVFEGRGWGHGVGMSQYGAYGFAQREGRDHRSILAHYYPGTDVGRAPATRIRVLLKSARTLRVCGATRARAGGRSPRLSEGRTYRFSAGGGDRLTVRGGRRTMRLRAPAIVTGGSSTCLRGRAENGVSHGAYRGRLVLAPAGDGVQATNHVSLEHYLYGVVPAEMPASWPAEALEAQAVVARSYALRSLRPAAAFDVFADVRSQVYAGVMGEDEPSTTAVRVTRTQVVRAGGEIAKTFFFSTSGGRTAANEEEWGGAPVSYLRSVEDPHDDVSPYHTWRARFSRDRAARALRGLTPGRFVRLGVASRTASGRAATVDIVGRDGTNTVPAATIRARLGLRSTWFEIR